mmetsp:Transcript_48891/g.102062  ORF Transcript_48891/g.102062 Transcript_48891/m.102062 type:complete len:200 (+) Transcript_48891:91-690(+)
MPSLRAVKSCSSKRRRVEYSGSLRKWKQVLAEGKCLSGSSHTLRTTVSFGSSCRSPPHGSPPTPVEKRKKSRRRGSGNSARIDRRSTKGCEDSVYPCRASTLSRKSCKVHSTPVSPTTRARSSAAVSTRSAVIGITASSPARIASTCRSTPNLSMKSAKASMYSSTLSFVTSLLDPPTTSSWLVKPCRRSGGAYSKVKP